MMQAAKYRLADNRANIATLDWPRNWCIFLETQVCSHLMVIGEVLLENPPEVMVVEHDDVVEAFPPD